MRILARTRRRFRAALRYTCSSFMPTGFGQGARLLYREAERRQHLIDETIPVRLSPLVQQVNRANNQRSDRHNAEYEQGDRPGRHAWAVRLARGGSNPVGAVVYRVVRYIIAIVLR